MIKGGSIYTVAIRSKFCCAKIQTPVVTLCILAIPDRFVYFLFIRSIPDT